MLCSKACSCSKANRFACSTGNVLQEDPLSSSETYPRMLIFHVNYLSRFLNFEKIAHANLSLSRVNLVNSAKFEKDKIREKISILGYDKERKHKAEKKLAARGNRTD